MTKLDNNWFTEEWPGEKSAISLKLKKKLHEEQSAFQRIEVFETETFGKLLTLDGLVMVTDRDNFVYHEMLSHPALFTHHKPEKVLIIGGGDCGTLQEVLKHKEVKQVDMVEIDERVTRVSEQFFPELCKSNNDPRANIRFDDGINWVKNCPAETYDVILVDGSDPEGPAAVLFSEEFFQACHRALKSGGIIAGQSESPLFHMKLISHIHKALAATGFKESRTLHFPQCTYPSGWWTCTMACKDQPISKFREQDVENKPFITHYYNVDVHRACSATPEFMKQALNK